MADELISKKTRYEFREHFVGMTLRQIEMEFDVADVPFDPDYDPPESGARRSLVEQYYHTTDFTKWQDVRKVLVVYGNVLAGLEQTAVSRADRTGINWARNEFESLKKWIERDGFLYQEGKLIPVAGDLHLPEMSEAAERFDAVELRRQIERMKTSVEDDPALAIGTAKELLETTCKTILRGRGVHVPNNPDVVDLVKLTRKTLSLMPEDIPDAARGANVVRRLLSNLGTVAQAVSELRNLYGTGHGRDGLAQSLRPRHARLAVGAASTLAIFLLETHEERD